MAATEVFVGIDIGTSGCRAAAITTSGQPIALHKIDLPPGRQPQAGYSEQAPEAWWQALCAVTWGLLARLDGCRPAALALDGTSGTLLLSDDAGQPLSPGLMYDDARGRPALPRIAAVAPPNAAVHAATSSLAKLLSLVATGAPPGMARVLHQAEWLAGRLINDYTRGDETNCLKLGYDPTAGGWPAWLADLGIPGSWLPRVLPVGGRLGAVTPAAARSTGLPAGLPVFAGTTDSVAAALAAGIGASGDAVTSLGSTLVLKILAEHPVSSAPHGVYSHRVFGRWLAGGASNSGGAVLRAFFTDREMAELGRCLRTDLPTGLDYYPLLSPGERFPTNDPVLPPRLTPQPDDRARFFQGLLEGIATIECAGYTLLQRLGAPAPRLILSTGGGAANVGWQKLRQRRLNAPVVVAQTAEAAVGAALVARRGASGD